MSTIRLYDLLPAAHRARDVEQGEPLRALLEVIQTQFDALEDDVRGLYENLFIETCDEWVVPYIGETLGLRQLQPLQSTEFSLRSFVGNTLRYRRRKGTAPVLEQVARDLTGWPCRVVEFFQLVSTTQHVKHPRLFSLGSPDLRRGDALERIGTPFQTAAHTLEVRRIAIERGRYNIANIGLFLWRLRDWTLERSEARPFAGDGRYVIDPLGLGVPLHNRPRSETDIVNLATESDVPGRLRRRPLWSELEAIRAQGDDADRVWFDAQPPFRVYLMDGGGTEEEVPVEAISVCDLSDDALGDWQRPEAPVRVSVDPVLGRLILATTEVGVTGVRITWAYASPGRYAGGPYDRSDSVDQMGVESFNWRRGVLRDTVLSDAVPADTVDALTTAIAQWNAAVAAATGPLRGLIVVLDNSSYDGNLAIDLNADCSLVIAAGQWFDDTPDAVGEWPITRLVADGRRPHVRGNVVVRTPDSDTAEGDRALVIDGMLIDGSMVVTQGDLTRLRLAHLSLVPVVNADGEGFGGGLTIQGGTDGKNAALQVELDHVWTGSVLAAPDAAEVMTINDCIIDSQTDPSMMTAFDQPAIVASSSTLRIDRTSVLGTTEVQTLFASDCIFGGTVTTERRQVGCVRYSWVSPADSVTPRRFRCQPDLALDALTREPGWEARDAASRDAERARVLAQIQPEFTSTTFGEPDYGMLAPASVTEIRTGAENGSEMGAFSALDIPLREGNLRASLDEFLPFGFEAGIFFVT